MSEYSTLPADFTESTFKRRLVKSSVGMKRVEIAAAVGGFTVFAVIVLAVGASRNQPAAPEAIQALVADRELGGCVRSELRAVQSLAYKRDQPLTVGEVAAARKICERRVRVNEVLDAQERALSWRPTPK